jgi:lysophospholipase L1-like esterase
LSDPVELTVADEADLAVSLYVAQNTEVTTLHDLAWQTSFISEPGDFTDVADMPVGGTITSWYWLTGVEVWAHRNTHAAVTLGDSITEGCCSLLFTDANVRYPDELARRLLARYPGEPRVAVLNSGISGNRVLLDIIGPNAQARLDRDVLTQSGVTHVILLEGVNDLGLPFFIGGPEVSADEIIAGYKQIIERLHAKGLKILVGTILPFKAFAYWSAAREVEREAVNEWIRTSNMHDGVVDFDQVIRDPNDPQRMLPAFDSGDNLHPSAAGYAAMGAEAEKALLAPGRGHIRLR